MFAGTLRRPETGSGVAEILPARAETAQEACGVAEEGPFEGQGR